MQQVLARHKRSSSAHRLHSVPKRGVKPSLFSKPQAIFALSVACISLLASASAQTAKFVASDTSTKGDWLEHYGTQGYTIVGAEAVPAKTAAGTQYAPVISQPANASSYIWSGTSGANYDIKSLYQPSGAAQPHIAALWYDTASTSGSTFTIDVPITDTAAHQVALYCLDWDSQGRAETVQVQSASSGAILDTQSISSFSDGKYLVWNVTGHVQFVVTQTAGRNAGISGVFFDTPTPVPTALGEINVTQYGAAGDGMTDNTAPFQNALNAAGRTGAIVKVPAGQYSFGSSANSAPALNVPDNVVLEGVNAGERTYLGYSSGTGSGDVLADHGTVLLVSEGASGTTPFLTLNSNSALRDMAIYYPNQPLSTSAGWTAPTPYPDTIFMKGTSSSVDYVCGVNPYSFITKGASVRTNVRHVSGQPLSRGLVVDDDPDVTHYEDIHFGQTWDNHAAMAAWMLANAWAFAVYRGDDMKFTDCSAVGYSRGFYCGKSQYGATSSGFQSCTAENCLNGVWIDAATNDGEINFHGCAFSSNPNTNGAAVMITNQDQGNVTFDGCRFWQAKHALFINQSTTPSASQPAASVTIIGCSFDTWGTQSTGLDPASAAILCGDPNNPSAVGGKMSITDCTFNADQYTYVYTSGTLGVLFEGNTTVNGTHTQALGAFPPGPGGYYKIQPASSTGLAMDDENFSTANRNGVQVYQDNGSAAQRWMLIPNSDGTFGISPACALGSGLDDYGGGSTTADLFQLMPGDLHTEWNLIPSSIDPSAPTLTVADGVYNINQAGASQLMLDSSSATPLGLSTQNGTSAQNWLLSYQAGYLQVNND